MKFTLSEWATIKCYLGTALIDMEECAADLEKEVGTNPLALKDYLECKMKIIELEGFITRIETATV